MTRRLLLCLTAVLALTLPPALLASGGGGGGASGPYFEINPPFVVNLQDGKRMRFMQIKVQAMSKDPAVIAALQKHNGPVRHAMLMLLSSQSIDTMRSVQGREEVRAAALDTLREVMREVGHVVGPEGLYFTDFVIQ